jgi:hypothetical protein
VSQSAWACGVANRIRVPCLEGDPAQLDALVDGRRAVVARRDNMAVDVDESLHAPR